MSLLKPDVSKMGTEFTNYKPTQYTIDAHMWKIEKMFGELRATSKIFNPDGVDGMFGHIVVKDVHLGLDRVSEHKTRSSVSRGMHHRVYRAKAVDMFKIEVDDHTGTMDEDETTFVLVQEFDVWNWRKTLTREYKLTCQQANNYYRRLTQAGYYEFD